MPYRAESVPLLPGETLGAWRRLTAGQRADRADRVRLESEVAEFPAGWRRVLRDTWERTRRSEGRAASNRWIAGTAGRLRAASKAGVGPGDSDAEVCRKAEREARLMGAWLDAVAVRVRRALVGPVVRRSREWIDRAVERAQALAARADLSARGLLDLWPLGAAITRRGVLARLRDPLWWRRALRRAQARLMESTAIQLGIVRHRRGCYVSDDSLRRRQGQKARNAAVLESVAAINDQRQEYTLADMAARGVANSAVRRAELMTRIAGFEVIAHDLGHPAHFVTVTCPSRMHKWRRGDDGDTPNPAYDGTRPDEAQQYLAGQWARMRSALARAALPVYGFRIAEPHHDGCPHWHMLLWHAPRTGKGKDAAAVLLAVLTRYFRLNDSPDERGADRHRITVEAIDPAKGSAVAYVAKYVAKNIDGYEVGADLYGNPALESSARVEAWAATWRIRQFQQIGGAPVTVWRELRRVHPFAAPMEAVQPLHDALDAVNLSALAAIAGEPGSEADEQHRIRRGWAAYVMTQGGPTAKRREHSIRLHREATGEINRYGEVKAAAPVGVVAYGQEVATVGLCRFERQRADVIESERAQWLIVPKRGVPAALHLHAAMADREAAEAAFRRELRREWWADHGANLEALGEAVRPWTRVNNCTQEAAGGLVSVEHRTLKTGRFFNWAGGRNRGKTDANPDDDCARSPRAAGQGE